MLTITEALAEIKTIGKRLEAKRTFVRQYLTRHVGLVDPLLKEGGSVQALREARQAITDLESRVVAIRMAIAEANNTTTVTVGPDTRTIAQWLVWKREVAPGHAAFLQSITQSIMGGRKQTQVRLTAQKAGEASLEGEVDTVVNVDEKALAQESEDLQTLLGELDGKLSLANAITTIDI